ncbi:MAG: NERD domain-containing protein [Spirochaetales bacterium]|nr:NERD domain-containing protein [Spirochaetales bacterium]
MFYIFLFLFIIVAVIILKIKAPVIKGAFGEFKVKWYLNKLDGEEYIVLNDLLLKTSHGTSQIDHVVVSPYGIYVIEVKNYKGWIHGHEKSEYWTQSIYKTKYIFRNPIKQNRAHINALKEILSDFKRVPCYSIVVFAGSAELINVENVTPVIYSHELYNTIIELRESPDLSIDQVSAITKKLHDATVEDAATKSEHIHQVQNAPYERSQNEKTKVCPWCKGMLIPRHGKYGTFIGCTNYPECMYTRNVERDEDLD